MLKVKTTRKLASGVGETIFYPLHYSLHWKLSQKIHGDHFWDWSQSGSFREPKHMWFNLGEIKNDKKSSGILDIVSARCHFKSTRTRFQGHTTNLRPLDRIMTYRKENSFLYSLFCMKTMQNNEFTRILNTAIWPYSGLFRFSLKTCKQTISMSVLSNSQSGRLSLYILLTEFVNRCTVLKTCFYKSIKMMHATLLRRWWQWIGYILRSDIIDGIARVALHWTT